jgi:molecular chaperone GrpE
MRELDFPNELTSTQELADSQLPPAAAHPEVAVPIASAGDAQPESPPASPSDPEADEPAEVVDEVLSDFAARELVGAIDRNGSEHEHEPVRADEPVPPVAPPPVEPPGIPTVLESVRVLSDQVNGRLEVIQAMVERELRAEMTRERVVDRLHAELQEYKQDLLLKVMRPVFVDLIQLHDEIGKMEDIRQSAASDADPEIDTVGPLLDSIRTGIEDILYRQGVEPFQHEQGSFDARRQRAVTTVTTDDPELNKTVATRIRKGFQAGDKVIRPELVSVYTLKK